MAVSMIIMILIVVLVSYHMGKTSGLAEGERDYNRVQQAKRLVFKESGTIHKVEMEQQK